MIVNGTKELEASRDVVWSVINDPAQMAGLMPGVEGFEIKDDRHWNVSSTCIGRQALSSKNFAVDFPYPSTASP